MRTFPTSGQPRVPSGVPAGGRWAPKYQPAPSGQLAPEPVLDSASADYRRRVSERRSRLAAGGYVPATTMVTDSGLNRPSSSRRWWDTAYLIAEENHPDGDYPRFEFDTTTTDRDGAERMAHRMGYEGAGVRVRMPSVSSVRRFAAECGSGTFDVPMSMVGPDGRSHESWVRVTRGDDGTWATRALGPHSKEDASRIAESVSAVLEARRPTRALKDVGDLLERRRVKMAAVGVRPKPVTSTWVTGLGYDQASETMVMTTRREVYGYHVDRSVYSRLASAATPGSTFNEVVKGRAKRVEVAGCGRCGRFHVAGAAHRCPTREAPRPGTAASKAG